MTPVTVVKVSGRELDDPAFLNNLCDVLATIERRVVLVHGGGKEITAAMEHFGQTVEFVEGLRVTPPASMDVMEMVVCGSINKRLVAKLVVAGRPALGMSGVDLGLLRCEPYRPNGLDLGRVGMVTAVDVEVLHVCFARGWLPVLAPVALGVEDGLAYNVNADHVAQAIAAALSATLAETELVFVSNVPGVIIENAIVPRLTAHEIEHFIAAGAITEGMIPKVRSALSALEAGVAAVRITNLKGLDDGGSQIV
jgi:acetylglutamate kinase